MIMKKVTEAKKNSSKKRVKKSNGEELLQAANKLQWTLGESLYKAKNLRNLVNDEPNLKNEFGSKINGLIDTLLKITSIYRHDIADKIKSKNL